MYPIRRLAYGPIGNVLNGQIEVPIQMICFGRSAEAGKQEEVYQFR